MNSANDIEFTHGDFELQITEDGSPTLSPVGGECMHNHKGALSEAFYIYQPAIAYLNDKDLPKSTLSVGLGLAYNEMIFAAEAIRGTWDTFYLESFENQDFLRDSLVHWLQSDIPSEVHHTICQLISQHYKIKPQKIKNLLAQALNNGQWEIRRTLDNKTLFQHRFSCVLFDAYSSKTSPKLWTEEILTLLLSQATRPLCVFRTYAATGNLTRCLKHHGFQVEARKGFGGKRESIWAEKVIHH